MCSTLDRYHGFLALLRPTWHIVGMTILASMNSVV